MNEKKVMVIIIICVCMLAVCFGAGYYTGLGLAVRETGSTDERFREQLEDKQRRIDELESRLADIGNLVSDGFRNVSGTVERVSGEIDAALQQSGNIRTTISHIREAVKILEDSERYFRELSARLSDGEYYSGSE